MIELVLKPPAEAQPLTPLRTDLEVRAGGPAKDGSPTYILHDPVRNAFFRLDWPTHEILVRWELGDAHAIADDVRRTTTLDLSAADVAATQQFLGQNQLLLRAGPADSAYLASRLADAQPNLWDRFVHNYLFFKIPLARPDAWLGRTAGSFDIFYSRIFFWTTVLAGAAGLLGVVRQWSVFTATIVDKFNLTSAALLAVTLVIIKICHELGHAVTAKRLGCHVATMGVAFVVLYPMAYTDVTESWKLGRMQRLQVASAGVLTELAIGAWALLGWGWVADGIVREICFFIATASLGGTLLINASPLMRFDGYYMASDALDLPNLHARAFAMAKWRLRESLFGFGDLPPETLPKPYPVMLAAFGAATAIYRLIVFTGIAFLVYHLAFKALGVVLFGIEIWYFILGPIVRELSHWWRRSKAAEVGLRLRPAVLAVILAAALFCAPTDLSVRAPAVLEATRAIPIMVTASGRAVQSPASGRPVDQGEVLIRVENPELARQTQLLRTQIAGKSGHLEVALLSDEVRSQTQRTAVELAAAQRELRGALEQSERQSVRAPFSGAVVDVPPDLAPGAEIHKGDRAGMLLDAATWQATAYVRGGDLDRLATGAQASFVRRGQALGGTPLQVVEIERLGSNVLGEPGLASVHKGEIAVREHNGALFTTEPLFKVRLSLKGPAPQQAVRQYGYVVVRASPKSPVLGLGRAVLMALARESGW